MISYQVLSNVLAVDLHHSMDVTFTCMHARMHVCMHACTHLLACCDLWGTLGHFGLLLGHFGALLRGQGQNMYSMTCIAKHGECEAGLLVAAMWRWGGEVHMYMHPYASDHASARYGFLIWATGHVVQDRDLNKAKCRMLSGTQGRNKVVDGGEENKER